MTSYCQIIIGMNRCFRRREVKMGARETTGVAARTSFENVNLPHCGKELVLIVQELNWYESRRNLQTKNAIQDLILWPFRSSRSCLTKGELVSLFYGVPQKYVLKWLPHVQHVQHFSSFNQ